MCIRDRQELQEALSRDQFELFYQPKVTLRSGLLRGVEGLIRWRHPVNGLISPMSFIPQIEKSSLINPLTRWVIRSGLSQLHTWHKQGFVIGMSLNLSATSLVRSDLADEIEICAQEIGVEPRHITFELTESSVMADLAASLEK